MHKIMPNSSTVGAVKLQLSKLLQNHWIDGVIQHVKSTKQAFMKYWQGLKRRKQARMQRTSCNNNLLPYVCKIVQPCCLPSCWSQLLNPWSARSFCRSSSPAEGSPMAWSCCAVTLSCFSSLSNCDSDQRPFCFRMAALTMAARSIL